MRKVVEAARFVRDNWGDEFALASPRILTDGIDAYLEEHGELRRVQDGQILIREVIADHLRPLVIASDGYAEAFRIEKLAPDIVIDPRFNAGAMSFVRNRVPVFAVAGALIAGEDPSSVAADFGLLDSEIHAIKDNLAWVSQVA